MKNGKPPQRVLVHGPTGAGKTTIARVLASYKYCLNPIGIGDPCGGCASCGKSLDGFYLYHEWTGNQIAQDWRWWKENMSTLFGNRRCVVFVDEAQELEKVHQAEFRTRLESAEAMVIFTTTHLHQLDDALINRFGVNVYELKRPTLDEVVDHLGSLCNELGVKAQRHHLVRVADNLGCDLRKCVDFAYTAIEQTNGGVVDDGYINLLLGLDPASIPSQPEQPRRRSKY